MGRWLRGLEWVRGCCCVAFASMISLLVLFMSSCKVEWRGGGGREGGGTGGTASEDMLSCRSLGF